MGKNRIVSIDDLSTVLAGIACSVSICFAGLAGMTQLVLMERIGEGVLNAVTSILLLLSTMVGCLIASNIERTNRLLRVAITGAGVLLVTFIIGLLMEGPFMSVLVNMVTICGGALIACVLCLKKPSKNKRRKKVHR